jgi:outer membrane protein assembly factor BamB
MNKCCIFLSICVFSFSAFADWPQFLGADRTGKVVDSKLTGSLGGHSPKELWKISVGEGFGGAAISKGDVFILDRENDENDIIRCIDLKSGKENWSTKYKSEGRFIPEFSSLSSSLLFKSFSSFIFFPFCVKIFQYCFNHFKLRPKK